MLGVVPVPPQDATPYEQGTSSRPGASADQAVRRCQTTRHRGNLSGTAAPLHTLVHGELTTVLPAAVTRAVGCGRRPLRNPLRCADRGDERHPDLSQSPLGLGGGGRPVVSARGYSSRTANPRRPSSTHPTAGHLLLGASSALAWLFAVEGAWGDTEAIALLDARERAWSASTATRCRNVNTHSA